MKTVTLKRLVESEAGTQGSLSTDGFTCKTLELPWRDNRRQRSCVPPGSYRCQQVQSPKFGLVYTLTGTEPRSNVLIHSGNFAGDVELGLKTHVQGCILLGKYFGAIEGQQAILLSRPTVRAFMAHMGGEPFILEIKGLHDA